MSHNATQSLAPTRDFSIRMHPSRQGARLARELAAVWLRDRHATRPVAQTAVQLVAELAANAALHGRVPGRDFLVELHVTEGDRALRVQVTDTRADRVPPATPHAPGPDAESGRGLLLVARLASRWGVTAGPPPRKTVWAELDLVPERGQPGSGTPGGLSHGADGY
ncbi:ATP-binding protein [Streptomyces sp. MUM 203J]|uniref:ATP-binding protein n=1 Tax=Streptomyces sp. MUM 203J TaxID=2791990 RepID=UPI001F0372DF|nr:ATP-binding protein [Streptomyces sp. MUM 203J]MCH0541130.1 ATP-binding protein [Streptomyces sp. MUM 203J]